MSRRNSISRPSRIGSSANPSASSIWNALPSSAARALPSTMGAGARLERALISFMLDTHTRKHGYNEVLPPFMVNSRVCSAPASCPSLRRICFAALTQSKRAIQSTQALKDGYPDELGKLARFSDHWLIPTAEVPVTNLYRDEILDEARLPISLTAYTPCFRAEAGAAGKDTRGIIRQHQFQKVELVKFTRPEESDAQHEQLTRNAEEILEALEPALPARPAVHWRHWLLLRQNLRPRSLAAGPEPLPRNLLLLQLRRLPGAPRQHPLPPCCRRRKGQARICPHAQRQRPGRRPHLARYP